MLYNIVAGLARIATKFLFRTKVYGKENVPKDGGMILAVNHKSNWDVIITAGHCPRNLRFMAKADLFKNKLFGAFISALGAFPVQRGRGDVGAIKGALKILKNNDVMLMFPEGHRIKDGKRVKPKSGVSMIAVHAKVPVVPLYITGDYKLFHKVTLTFGEPITFDEYYGEKLDNNKIQELAESVMETIYSLDNTEKTEIKK